MKGTKLLYMTRRLYIGAEKPELVSGAFFIDTTYLRVLATPFLFVSNTVNFAQNNLGRAFQSRSRWFLFGTSPVRYVQELLNKGNPFHYIRKKMEDS